MSKHPTKLIPAGVVATIVLMVAATGTPALAQGMADDSACVLAGLLGEEFGLCNAYCEAMDCDSETPQASAKACEKVRAKFEAIEGMPELPCLDQSGNEPPTLDLDFANTGTFDTTATFVSFGDAVPIAVNVEITDDPLDVITSATVTLTNPVPGENETLSLTPAGHDLLLLLLLPPPSGPIAGEGTAALTISGEGDFDLYEEILQQVIYDNGDDSPLTDPDRSIQVVVSDGFDDSNTATSLMAVEVGCPCTSLSSGYFANLYWPWLRRTRDITGLWYWDPMEGASIADPPNSCDAEFVTDPMSNSLNIQINFNNGGLDQSRLESSVIYNFFVIIGGEDNGSCVESLSYLRRLIILGITLEQFTFSSPKHTSPIAIAETDPSSFIAEVDADMATACKADYEDFLTFIRDHYYARDLICTVTGP